MTIYVHVIFVGRGVIFNKFANIPNKCFQFVIVFVLCVEFCKRNLIHFRIRL